MTARPQDVALLPLPELPVPHGGMTGDYWTDDQIEEYATDYARANVTAALASAQAREEELRAEVERLRGLLPEFPPYPPDGGGLPRYGLRWNGPEDPLSVPMEDGYWTPWHLAERLAEALRERRDWFETQAKSISKGNGSSWDLMQVREQRDLCDAALSTNAATQTGETNEAAE